MKTTDEKYFDHFCNSIILAVDSHNGRYSMEYFLETYTIHNSDELQEEIKMCKTINNESIGGYYESWQRILDYAIILDKNGKRYRLEQNEDIWFIPEDMETPEDWYM